MGMRDNHEQNSRLLIQLAPLNGIRVLLEDDSESSDGDGLYPNDYCVDGNADEEEF